MSPWDARLTLLAQEAGVRTHHCFWVWHAIAADPAAFNIAAAALFTGLEARHIEAIIAALRQNDLMPQPKGRNRRTQETVAVERATRLPADFQVPREWVLWAQTERGWTPDVAETVAHRFVDHWHGEPPAKAVKSDWHAVWRKWVRSPYSPESGVYTGKDSTPLSTEAEAERLAGNEAFLRSIGRE